MSPSRFLLAMGFLFGFFLPSAAHGCLWDFDTLMMERQQFPEALELITGKKPDNGTPYWSNRSGCGSTKERMLMQSSLAFNTKSRN